MEQTRSPARPHAASDDAACTPAPLPTAHAQSLAHPAATFAEYGHNPDDYHWVPVLKKRRAEGWAPDKQRRFIEILADVGSVKHAARNVRMAESELFGTLPCG